MKHVLVLPALEVILPPDKKQAQPRVCLKCRKLFPSRGPYNRLCNRCIKNIADTH